MDSQVWKMPCTTLVSGSSARLCEFIRGRTHINETYARLYAGHQMERDTPLYVLQRININVFQKPGSVMADIQRYGVYAV